MIDEIPPRAQPPPERGFRMWRWRRNPLRRRTDLAQGWIGLALSLAVLTAAPLAMLLVGDSVHRSLRQTAEDEARSRYRTTAVLLDPAPHHPEPGSDEAMETRYPVQVRFTDANGRTRTGETAVQPGLPAESTVRVWSDDKGALTDAPLTAEEVRSRTIGWATAAGAGVVLTGAVTYAVVIRVLDRRRLTEWERSWADTAPHWIRNR